MTFIQIQSFLAVAQYLNFSKAAEAIHTSQPAISYQIRMLEKELGTKLLDRNSHSVQLTKSGYYLYHEIQEPFHQCQAVISNVMSDGNRWTPLRVSCNEVYGMGFIRQVFPKLLALQEDAVLDFTICTPRVFQPLLERKIDIGFILYQETSVIPDDIAIQTICPYRLYLLTAPGSPLSSKSCISEEELKELNVIFPNLDNQYRPYWLKERYEMDIQAPKTYSTLEEALLYAQNSSNPVYLPGTEDTFYPGIVRIPISYPGSFFLAMVWRKSDRNREMKIFLKAVQQSLKEMSS